MAEAANQQLVFTFPGQGSYRVESARELFDKFPFADEFQRASAETKLVLGQEFLPLLHASPAEEASLLESCPELDQVVIYVTNYLVAQQLIASGLRPGLLLGHSFGELAALAVAGVYSFETGVRIVCQRSKLLRQLSNGGQMAAATADTIRVQQAINSIGLASLEIAVVNHAKQTVVSGMPEHLAELGRVLAGQGIGLTPLKSRYPFHSSLLKPVVEAFRLALCSYDFQPPLVPVYLCTEGRLLTPADRLSDVLSDQLVKKLDFAGILTQLHGRGFRQFVECGAGNIIGKLIQQSEFAGVEAYSAAADGVAEGCAKLLSLAASTTKPIGAEMVHDLVKGLRQSLENASRYQAQLYLNDTPALAASLSRRSAPIQPEQPVAVPKFDVKSPEVEPVAIVSMGCVLPGAHNPEQYWSNVLNGVSGIADLAKEDIHASGDFQVVSDHLKIVPDKTYTLLHGSAGKISYDARVLSKAYSEEEFNRLTRVEKLLSLAAGQALAGLGGGLAGVGEGRIECILGATADGSNEYDYAVFAESLTQKLEVVEPDSKRRAAFSAALQRIWGEPPTDRPRAAQSDSYREVMSTIAGRPIRSYVVDAACSSSLYAISLGLRALQDRTADVALVGGAFAPAMANSALFAQFRGLSPNGSRPFDKGADGVIFGEGAGIVVLKRLSDAVKDGDRIWGVVRGVGISSDGKSPAINVPQSGGQNLAMVRAYEAAQLSTDTIQYVEAHATATPVGDAVEFNALCKSFPRDASLPRIELGSVKALLGHTGWAAGVASVIKLCKAIEKQVIPPQYNFTSPSPEIPLETSPFRISTSAKAWPANSQSLPRRASINGFGFGGTNAHLILEEYDTAYHDAILAGVPKQTEKLDRLAVIASAALYPGEGAPSQNPTDLKEFPRNTMRLPKGKMLLPDVTEHMDPGQYLAMLAAERVLPALGEKLQALRASTGVVIGVESKTERGIFANQRIFLDRLKRRFASDKSSEEMPASERSEVLDRLCKAVLTDVRPSGPYTLSGLMPNVISGRVANIFDLKGPNIVVDMGPDSLLQSILVARDFLSHGDCKAVLAGGLNAIRNHGDEREGAFLAMLTTEATAKELGLPVACIITVERRGTPVARRNPSSFRGAEGILEISQGIQRATDHKEEFAMGVEAYHAGTLTMLPPGVDKKTAARPSAVAVSGEAPKVVKPQPVAAPAAAGAYAFVQGTPIYDYTPVETAAPLPSTAGIRRARKVLFLVDQPRQWRELEEAGAFAGLDYHVISTQDAGLSRSTTINPENEAEGEKLLAAAPLAYDTIVPVTFLGTRTPDALLVSPVNESLALVKLMFLVSRCCYAKFQEGSLSMANLCFDAFRLGRLDPATGLYSGFLKSMARELPASIFRHINVSGVGFGRAWGFLEAELAHAGQPVEVCYHEDARSVIEVARVEKLSDGNAPLLTKDSLVLATGAGRGVTAVLAEEILNRFGCTVVAIGRTDPKKAPAEVLKMTVEELAAYEQEFYRVEIAKGGRKITELKSIYRGYQAAHEVHAVIDSLSKLPGRFEYISADISNGDAARAAVDSAYEKYGKVDLVLHGAGTQISKMLTKKSVRDFSSVIESKLASLRYIHEVCEKRRAGKPVHYHLLTSAFSYMGNDGQPDYGAVNEALNRLADTMAAQGGASWCSVGWLGWAGIGMTRGSEFAALAANRGLRGITKPEGQEIFSHFLTGEATAPINILLADGELKYYQVATTPEPFQRPDRSTAGAKRNSLTMERIVSVAEAPYLLDHRVDGTPTLPGAYIIMAVAEAARELRPDLKVTAFEDAAFRRFVRLKEDSPLHLRLKTWVVSEDDASTLIRVEVLADFIHKSGRVLQKDAVQTEMSVRMSKSISRAKAVNGVHKLQGKTLSDPYVMGGSPIKLDGAFKTLTSIVVGDVSRTADYFPTELNRSNGKQKPFISSLLMMDSLWRFGAIDVDEHNAFPVYVPEACQMMKVHFDLSDPGEASALVRALEFTGSNPVEDNDKLTIGPVEVRDASGSILLTVTGGVCRRLGEVANAG